MPVHNSEIAQLFEHLADLLEIQGANRFRIRAYRNAAYMLRDLPRSAADMVKAGEDLSRLPGIGEDLAGKIAEIVETGHLSLLDETRKEIPDTLTDLTALPGIGPQRAKALFKELNIRSLSELKSAAEAGKVAKVPGFGPKSEKNIRDELIKSRDVERRFWIAVAEDFAEPLLDYVKGLDGVKQAIIAGSYRRRKETVGDLDILVTSSRGADVTNQFINYEEIDQVISKGTTRSTVVLRSGLQVDLRVVSEVSYGAALHYFTGSKAHNIAVRRRGIERGLRVSEYGVFRGNKRVAGRTEGEVYAAVDLPFIAVELRENRGEIEAAEEGRLPRLVELDDIRGDLHVHTTASDGKSSLREMALAAKKLGHEYLAITDHSRSAKVAGGLDEKQLLKQLEEIDKFNEELVGIRILKSSEVDILEDGRLDYPDSVLKELELVVGAVHSKFGLSEIRQTERIIRAMHNRHFSILAHPTGRLIGERPPYSIDLEKVLSAAKKCGCFLEINSHPARLDLDDVHCRLARDMGVKIAVSTDAHSTGGLGNLRFGVDQARRGWLEADHVLNTRSWTALSELIARK